MGRMALAAAVAGSLLLVGAGCGGSSSTAEEPMQQTTAAVSSAVTLVSPAEAEGLLDDDEVRVIDVRTPQEYGEGHLEGATLIDFYSPDFERRVSELDPDGRYLVYCRSGNRSGQATALMADKGFASVADLDGGIVAWQAAGLPVEP